uniref:RING-CH-type domain-containing protein n=1 Tax=Steinernema glaseri TaxID=37863 RepID=A0A1I8ART3_9BILA
MPDAEAVSLQSEVDGPNCRICYCSADEPLCNPCKCTGTVRYVHQGCLDRWVELRPSDWNGRCDVCQYKLRYEDHAVSQGAVTWSIYFSALGKYLLSVGSLVLTIVAIFASFLLNMKSIANEVHSRSVLYLTASSTVINLQMAFVIMRYLKLPLVRKHLKWAKTPLPTIGRVKCRKKIRETTYRDVIRSDVYYALGVLGFVFVTTVLVQLLGHFLPTPQMSNVTTVENRTSEAVESTPSRWTKGQLEMEALALFFMGMFFLLEVTSVGILPFHEFLNRLIRHALAFFSGKLFNRLITTFFVGWFTESYNSALIASTVFLDLASGHIIVLELSEHYIIGYSKLMNVAVNPNILRFPIQNGDNKYREGLRRIQHAIVFIWVTLAIFILFPLYFTQFFCPSALPLNLGAYDTEDVSRRVFGELTNRSETVRRLIEGMNFTVQAMFVFNIISYVMPVVTLVFAISKHLHKAFNVKRDVIKGGFLALFTMVTISLSFTVYTLFTLFLGRSISSTIALPEAYSNDVVSLAVGWLLLRLFGTTVEKFLRTCGILVSCFCNVAMYLLFIRLIMESYNPVHLQTIFIFTWIFVDPKAVQFARTDKEVFQFAWSSVQRLAIQVSILLPLYIGIWAGILPSSLEMTTSFSSFKWFFLGYSLGLLVIVLTICCIYLLFKLHQHLRYEYEEIRSILINYNPEEENAPPNHKIWTAMKPYKDYSICGYVWRSACGVLRKKPETSAGETGMQNEL